MAQIKTAISEVEKGNQFAFASGKQARQEEKQMAHQFKWVEGACAKRGCVRPQQLLGGAWATRLQIPTATEQLWLKKGAYSVTFAYSTCSAS